MKPIKNLSVTKLKGKSFLYPYNELEMSRFMEANKIIIIVS